MDIDEDVFRRLAFIAVEARLLGAQDAAPARMRDVESTVLDAIDDLAAIAPATARAIGWERTSPNDTARDLAMKITGMTGGLFL
jgi:hypothetical protein